MTFYMVDYCTHVLDLALNLFLTTKTELYVQRLCVITVPHSVWILRIQWNATNLVSLLPYKNATSFSCVIFLYRNTVPHPLVNPVYGMYIIYVSVQMFSHAVISTNKPLQILHFNVDILTPDIAHDTV